MKKEVVAFVPMKDHSERIPYKNVKKFNGKPLLFWILRTLLNSRFISDVLVDTDSLEVKKIIRQHFKNAIKIIDRPKHLYGDYVSINRILKYDMTKIEGDIFLHTHSTNPLLKRDTLDEAIKTYFEVIKKGYDSLFVVTSFHTRFYDSKFKPMNHDPYNLIPTQNLKPVYQENSNFYIFSRRSFKKTNSRIGIRPYLFEVPKLESSDIDEEEDFFIAEAIFSYTKHKG